MSLKYRLRTMTLAIVAILILCAAYAYWSYNRTTDLGVRVVTVVVVSGESFSRVADTLAIEGVVPSRFWLAFPARLTNVDIKLTPGRYDFRGRNSCRSVLSRFRRGDFMRVRITVPEGWPIWRTASLLAEKLDLDSTTFVALNTDSVFLAEEGLPCLEGFLFPETYHFAWGVSEKGVAIAMIDQYRALTDSVWTDSIVNGLTQLDIIKLASIIEAETRLDSERVLVASVYINRLRRSMRLDADPTVIYGLGGLDHPLYRRDLKRDTPFNTYLHKGFPPTPINSPGLDAIRAALHPAETDYLFFVANERGRHIFSRTNAEHNRARRSIRLSSGK